MFLPRLQGTEASFLRTGEQHVKSTAEAITACQSNERPRLYLIFMA